MEKNQQLKEISENETKGLSASTHRMYCCCTGLRAASNIPMTNAGVGRKRRSEAENANSEKAKRMAWATATALTFCPASLKTTDRKPG